MGNRADVTVDIPSYKQIKLPRIAIEGTFYHVVEESGAVTEVVVGGVQPKRPAPPTDLKVTTDG
jgi:hypothetical protein